MKTTLLATRSGITRQGQKNLDKMSNVVMSNVGTILDDKYEIKREIARGGMGVVYEAYHKYTHKRVAIKLILADKVEPIQLKRFQKELEAYSLLSHPNVITIHDAGVYNNYPYIVMEYIEGVDICTYVKQQEEKTTPKDSKNKSRGQKSRDWRLCARLIYETALGLEYIHSQNMIHRDIKPANIIVRPNGSPVIIDLGLVKFNRTQSWNLTKSRELMGTIEYMPIEQAQGKRGQIDARTDVYSLGLVLYELLTGQIAYTGKNIMESYYKIMSYYPPLPREINPQIPEVLEEITIHAMEKQQEKRYASMKEFSDALKEYLSDTTVKPTPQYAKIKKRLWIERNKNKVITSCIAVLLAIVLVIIVSIIGKQTISNTSKIKSNISQNDQKLQNDEKNKNATDNATKENLEEQFKLGVMYENGLGVQQNLQKARELYEKAATQGNAIAQCNLGDMYFFGKGVQRNLQKARELYKKAATQGNAIAQYNLGDMYFFGKGVQRNLQKARELYEKAANQEHASAQYNLGLMYKDGIGVKQDSEKAFYWYEKAATQGNAEAQNNLGFMYAEGQGVQQDHKQAFYWYEKAATQGNVEAQNNLGFMYAEGQGVQQDHKQAVYWLEKSANQEHAKAQFNLGAMYASGQGVQQDLQKAFELFEKSANQGNAKAQFNLGAMYASGQGVQQDFKKAFELFEKSANQGFAEAQFNLGMMYANGDGVEKDLKKAQEWYEKAANQGHKEAKQRLNEILHKK